MCPDLLVAVTIEAGAGGELPGLRAVPRGLGANRGIGVVAAVRNDLNGSKKTECRDEGKGKKSS